MWSRNAWSRPISPGGGPGRGDQDPIRHTAEVIIAGWYPATGAQHLLGSLLLVAHDADGELVHVGEVGTGFTDTARRALLEELIPLARDDPPFTGSLVQGWRGRSPHRGRANWAEPRLVGEIEYRAFGTSRTTGEPTGFRHPSWRGLRPDREPGEVQLPITGP